LSFYIDDVEDEWTYKDDEAFDVIHARCMGGSISDWDKLYARCYKHLKPGGWLEMQEPEGMVTSDDDSKDKVPFTVQWQTLCNQAAAQFGKEINLATTHKQRLIDAGFVDVGTHVFKVSLEQPTSLSSASSSSSSSIFRGFPLPRISSFSSSANPNPAVSHVPSSSFFPLLGIEQKDFAHHIVAASTGTYRPLAQGP